MYLRGIHNIPSLEGMSWIPLQYFVKQYFLKFNKHVKLKNKVKCIVQELFMKCQIFLLFQYVNEVKIDGDLYMTKVNTNPTTYTDLKVYASNPFIDSFDGKIKLVIFNFKHV